MVAGLHYVLEEWHIMGTKSKIKEKSKVKYSLGYSTSMSSTKRMACASGMMLSQWLSLVAEFSITAQQALHTGHST